MVRNTHSEDSWADLLAKDARDMLYGPKLSEYTVGALGFPAGSNDKLSIVQIANRLQTDLIDADIFNKHDHIFLVSHSLGGLVAKEIFNNLKILSKEKSDKLRGIFLISTPSQGSNASKLISDLSEILAGPLITDLQPIDVNTYLQSLEVTWQNHLRRRKPPAFPKIYCAYETKETAGVLVVPLAYIATTCDETPRAEDADHSSIVRPKTIQDSIYGWVRGRIKATLKIHKDYHDRKKVAPRPVGVTYIILIGTNGGAVDVSTIHPMNLMLGLFKNLQSSLQNGSNPLSEALKVQNSVFKVISGTKVKILDFPPGIEDSVPSNKLGKYVEILEGNHKGKKGWVSVSHVQRKTAN